MADDLETHRHDISVRGAEGATALFLGGLNACPIVVVTIDAAGVLSQYG
jgi:hypothetical protein